MKIALLAPFEERVPPRKYGGTENVVYVLAEELHKMGHDVTVFASGDSTLSARVIPIVPTAIGSGLPKRIREAKTYQALVKVLQYLEKEKFDILHNHIGWQALNFKDMFKLPFLSTIHLPLGAKEWNIEHEMFKEFGDTPLVSISDDQRTPLPDLNYIETVYHGMQVERFPFIKRAGHYLAFLGRLSPVKGPLEAIHIAKKTGHKLMIGAKINDFERDFYEKEIKPHIDGEQIVYLGELNFKDKLNLLKNAKALLSPIKWSEPFGLVNTEAMACGTPVIGSNIGSLPELIVDGKTGFICDTVDEMCKRVHQLDSINRAACREHIEENFSSERMAQQYLRLYRKLARSFKLKHIEPVSKLNRKLI